MSKKKEHDALFKLKLITEYQRGDSSIRELSKNCGISHSLMRKWLSRYNTLGVQGLSRRPSHYYSKVFKLEVVQRYHREGLSLVACCLRYNIANESTVISWLRKYEALGIDAFREQRGRPTIMKKDKPSSKKIKPLTRLEELEKENLYLRAENELLKKLEALAQQKEAQKKKR